MNNDTSAVLAPVTAKPSKVAPVIAIARATDAQVSTFCDAILLGLPTHRILPAAISELKASGGITADQLARIKVARKEHEQNSEADRAVLFRLARSRRVRGARFNAAGSLIALRFGDRIAAK
jgi:hypothetical protein